MDSGPGPGDFGITPEEYALYAERKVSESTQRLIRLLTHVTFWVVFITLGTWAYLALGWRDILFWAMIGSAAVGCIATLYIEEEVIRCQRRRLLARETGRRIRQYEEALRVYREAEQQRQLQEELAREQITRALRTVAHARYERIRALRRQHAGYWMSLSGIEFEREMARIFRSQGYLVSETPASGDQGIDLVLYRDGRFTVVQCKRWNGRAGRPVATELLGAKVSQGANSAILACTGGFTRQARKFARDNDIELLSMPNFIQWSLREKGEEMVRNEMYSHAVVAHCLSVVATCVDVLLPESNSAVQTLRAWVEQEASVNLDESWSIQEAEQIRFLLKGFASQMGEDVP